MFKIDGGGGVKSDNYNPLPKPKPVEPKPTPQPAEDGAARIANNNFTGDYHRARIQRLRVDNGGGQT